jgi:hypothetical protein
MQKKIAKLEKMKTKDFGVLGMRSALCIKS